MQLTSGAILSRHLSCKMAALGISKSTGVAVGLSGGADSLGLALAISWWSGTNGNPPAVVQRALKQTQPVKPASLVTHLSASQYMQHLLQPRRLELHCTEDIQQPHVVALSVDHGLRPESNAECQQAASQAAAMGMQSQILPMEWRHIPNTGHLMEQASILRYQLLHQACKARGISVLMTGHHAGDQVENLMMRVSRASGIAGLASIAEASWLSLDTDHPLLLVRPFLDLPKWHLEAACTEQALSWADDPTNRDTKFLRNHVRALLSQSTAPAQPQQALCNSTPNSPPTSAASHVQSNAQSIHLVHVLPPGFTRKAQDSEKQLEYSPGTAQVGVSQGPVGERSDIVDAILQVQRCCATAHQTVASQAKELLQASLQLSLQSRQMDEAGQQQKHEWSLAVKPYAEAQPAVALHALSAVMQAVSIRHKQPKLRAVQRLLTRMASGKMRGSYVANDCIISPVVFSRGEFMTVQQVPVCVDRPARRHQ